MEPDSQTHDPALLRKYLLGELTEAERDRVEEDLFSQEDSAVEISLAEDDLIDAYVAGELPGAERDRFESSFLQSPRRRERVATARALATAAQKAGTRRLEVVSRNPLPPSRRIANWVWPLAAAAAVILITGATLMQVNAYLSRQSSETARLSREVERLQSQLSSRAPATQIPDKETLIAEVRKSVVSELEASRGRVVPPAPLIFTLPFAATRRGASQPGTRLILPAGQQTANLRLQLRADTNARKYAAYRAVIQTAEGGQVWGGDVRITAGNALTLPVPSVALQAGDYRVLLSGVGAAGEVEALEEYYVFSVVTR